MRDPRKTIRYQIASVLIDAGITMTAAQISRKMPGRKLASIASELNKMAVQQYVLVSQYFGGRGGKGYSAGVFMRTDMDLINRRQLDLDLPPRSTRSLHDMDTEKEFKEFWGDDFWYGNDDFRERRDDIYGAFVAGVEAAQRFLNPEDA